MRTIYDYKDIRKFESSSLAKEIEDGVIVTAEIGKTDFLLARKEVALIAESGKELLGTVYF